MDAATPAGVWNAECGRGEGMGGFWCVFVWFKIRGHVFKKNNEVSKSQEL